MNKCKNCRKQINSSSQHGEGPDFVKCCICLLSIHSSCAERDSDMFYCKEDWAMKRTELARMCCLYKKILAPIYPDSFQSIRPVAQAAMNKCIDCKEQTKSDFVKCCICLNYLHPRCAKKDSDMFYCEKHWAVKHGEKSRKKAFSLL